MMKSLFKYQLGLAVVGLFTVGLVVFLVTQSASVRQDNKTFAAATDIAKKLNSYVSDKRRVPASLSEAGVSSAPAAVRYHKDSKEAYTFCVTYKAASSNFDANGALQQAIMSRYYGPGGGGEYDQMQNLYIPDTHHKGENCYTVKPDIYSGNSGGDVCQNGICLQQRFNGLDYTVPSSNGSSPQLVQ